MNFLFLKKIITNLKENMNDHVVIITGAANGLGRATGIAAAKAGYKLLLVDIDAKGLADSKKIINASGGVAEVYQANVSLEQEVIGYVTYAMTVFGRIDGFFNNAGILGTTTPLTDTDVVSFDRVLTVNVKGVFLGMKHIIPIMQKQGNGSIVNTASMGAVGGLPGLASYSASKHAVVGLTKVAALEVAKSGIRVNSILPGTITTEMALKDVPAKTLAEKEAILAMSVPQGKAGKPADIANTVLFLFSDVSAHITGITLPVDGGITAQVYPSFS
ncbi:SDR family NAD(P)-dependent oxidoreductase [Neptunitalea lumnitzerae]|uniref:Short chain dehydrogenase n=1 Tax=Neptunitalea lumnitzerae TaxID=2965509 RepID=A0ABQ5MJ51_9FLAO|nr:SDR family oxidoreductase [Neptunitalea sp. Y10]GLB49446.1 short chain dehydrogenase [Neptunitalea sp. Y10]